MTEIRKATLTGGWIIAGFGAIMAIFNLPGLNGLLDKAFELVLWTGSDQLYADIPEARLIVAVTGGIALAWGVLQIGLAHSFGDSQPEALRRIVLRAYWAWFIVDGAGSVIAGAPLNLIGNALFLAVLLLPFYRGARQNDPA